MKRPLSIAVSAAVFTSVIAGALTLSMLKLMQPKSASSTAAAPPKEVVSASSKATPTIVGTDHPVPVSPPLRLAASPKSNAPNPPGTPVPKASALAENNTRRGAESPSKLVREQAEQAREKATPVPQASAVAENDSRQEAESPSEVVREQAEKAREKAERLRARVEDLYQSRRISEAAYKQGQAEYQRELAEYEGQIAKLRGTTNGPGATNE